MNKILLGVALCAALAARARADQKLVDEPKVKLTLATYQTGEIIEILAGGKIKEGPPTTISIVYLLEGKVRYGDDTIGGGDAAWEAGPSPRKVDASKKKPTRILTLTVPETSALSASTFVRRAKDATEYKILGGKGKVTIVIDKDSGGDGSAYVGRLRLDKGTQVPEHSHDGSAEVLYVVSGKGELTLDGKTIAVEPGTALYIPPNTKHSFAASEDIDAVQFYSPSGPEQRFKAPPAAAPAKPEQK